ncbi:MAG: EAL domain-containing protein [Acidimicrobiales bacterium]
MNSIASSNHASRIRVVLIDDHQMVTESLARLLGDQDDMAVMAQAGTVKDGLAAIKRHRPDVVVMDYQLPDGDGASAARQIIATWPDIRVVMLTGSDVEEAVFSAIQAGCSGFLDKTEASGRLAQMLRQVHAGATLVPQEQLGRLPSTEQLVVHFQPIVELATGSTAGFEALVRWEHPERGLLPPSEFIGLAERTGLVTDIDDRVRHVACRQAVEWARRFPATPPRYVSVNVSGRELRLNDLTDRIAKSIEETGIQPSGLVLEITETFFVGDAHDTARQLNAVKDLGIKLALDDFGTGYSSLGYLRSFPIDIIKLDKSFTDELPYGQRGLRLLDAVGRLAADMDALTVAEGVETAQQAACLHSLGWNLGQGYYFSPPLPPDAIEIDS